MTARSALHPLASGDTRWMLLVGGAAGVAACAGWVGAGVFLAAACAAPALWYAFSVRHGWIFVFLISALLLPPLPVAWGDSGPHVAVCVAGVGVLAVLVRAHEWRIRFTFLNAAVVSFLAALGISVGFAAFYSGPVIATNSAIRVALFGISVLVFFSASQGPDSQSPRERHQTLRRLFWASLASAAFGCIDFWLQLPAPAGYGAQYIWLDSGVYRRAQGLFYEASTLGTFCSLWVVMAAVALFHRRSKTTPGVIPLSLGGIIFGLALLLSYSRSAMASTVVACCTLAILERKRWLNIRALAGAALSVAVIAGLLALIFPEFAHSYWARFNFTFTDALTRPDRVLSGRLESWRILADFIASHPGQALLGIGYKTLAYTDHFGAPVIADNTYLSVFVETGLAGFVALVALNAAILSTAWRSMRRTGSIYAKWIFCFWTGFACQMLAGDVLTYWRVLPLVFWVLAAAVRDLDDAHPVARSIR